MNWNYLNPIWLLSRLLEKLGLVTYLSRVEFAAHIFAGATFTLLNPLSCLLWALLSVIDEFCYDGYKGKDTWIDLFSKLICPVVYLISYIVKLV
jgi:hypothetical protein